jgi:hypothetical protein
MIKIAPVPSVPVVPRDKAASVTLVTPAVTPVTRAFMPEKVVTRVTSVTGVTGVTAEEKRARARERQRACRQRKRAEWPSEERGGLGGGLSRRGVFWRRWWGRCV